MSDTIRSVRDQHTVHVLNDEHVNLFGVRIKWYEEYGEKEYRLADR